MVAAIVEALQVMKPSETLSNADTTAFLTGDEEHVGRPLELAPARILGVRQRVRQAKCVATIMSRLPSEPAGNP